MPKRKEIEEHNITLIGDFNPTIFQPAWFALQGLIRSEEAEEVDIKIIHPDVVGFNLKWVEMDITRNKFSVRTTQNAFYEFMRDLVLGTFEILKHTPLRMLGINLSKHLEMKNEDEWHKFGDTLAPKDIWKNIFENPGMRSLTIEEPKPPNGVKGFTRITIEPSAKILPGVYFNVNDHYEVHNSESVTGSNELMSIFGENWGNSIPQSNKIIYQILEEI